MLSSYRNTVLRTAENRTQIFRFGCEVGGGVKIWNQLVGQLISYFAVFCLMLLLIFTRMLESGTIFLFPLYTPHANTRGYQHFVMGFSTNLHLNRALPSLDSLPDVSNFFNLHSYPFLLGIPDYFIQVHSLYDVQSTHVP
jgi:hypothetical protein